MPAVTRGGSPLASIFRAALSGRMMPAQGGPVGLILLDGYVGSAGVARWEGFPGPVGFLGSGGRWPGRSGEGGPKSLPCLANRGCPPPGGVDA